jgi:transcription elongation factor GreA
MTPSADPIKKLEPVKAFLAQAQKEGWIKTNLALHLRVRKVPAKSAMGDKGQAPAPYRLTPQGYAELKSELANLKSKRPQVAEELRKARADKDFRENAPLDAMREYQGQMEARIKELEAILKSVAIVEHGQESTFKVEVGSSVRLHDLDSGEDLSYTLVNPGEMDPARGKISIASPTGKALLGRGEGEVIEVSAPAGKLRYHIESIGR